MAKLIIKTKNKGDKGYPISVPFTEDKVPMKKHDTPAPAITFESRYMYTTDGTSIAVPTTTANVVATMVDINNILMNQAIYDCKKSGLGINNMNDICCDCTAINNDIIFGQFEAVLVNLRECFIANVNEIIGNGFKVQDDITTYRHFRTNFYYNKDTNIDMVYQTAMSIANNEGCLVYNMVQRSIAKYMSTVVGDAEICRMCKIITVIDDMFRTMMMNMTYEASVYANNVTTYMKLYVPIYESRRALNNADAKKHNFPDEDY